MSPLAIWPSNLNTPPRYTLCWRCGIDLHADRTQRTCRDCYHTMRGEGNLWNQEPTP